MIKCLRLFFVIKCKENGLDFIVWSYRYNYIFIIIKLVVFSLVKSLIVVIVMLKLAVIFRFFNNKKNIFYYSIILFIWVKFGILFLYV